MATLEFFYDFSSPFAYLGSTQIERVAEGHTLVWRPFLLGALFKAIGTPMVPIAAFPEAKARHALVDQFRWADHWGVPFRFPRRFPQRSVTALRLVLGTPEARRAALSHALFRLVWVEDGSVEDEADLTRALEACEIEAAPALARTQTPEAKAELRAATEDAVRRGVPGAPTCIVDGQVFWGQDRLDFARRALDGWRPEVPGGLALPREG